MVNHFKPNSKYQILTPDGFKNFAGINLTFKGGNYVISLENGDTLSCSDNHLVLTSTGFKVAKNLTWLDSVETSSGVSKVINVKEVIRHQYPIELYDPINVGDKFEYYSNGIVSHNCQFLGTGDTYIDGETLTLLHDNSSNEFTTQYSNKLRQWSLPNPYHQYVMGVDVSLGREKDYSAFHIINSYDGEQVLEFYSNKTPLDEFASIISTTGKLYNNALVIPERNTIGNNLIDMLLKREAYENVWMDKKGLFGFQTSQQTRVQMLALLEDFVRTKKIKINSDRTVKELLTFIIDEAGKPVADEGMTDDLVISLALTCFGLNEILEKGPGIISKLTGSESYDPLEILTNKRSAKIPQWGNRSYEDIKWVLGN